MINIHFSRCEVEKREKFSRCEVLNAKREPFKSFSRCEVEKRETRKHFFAFLRRELHVSYMFCPLKHGKGPK